MARNQSGLKQFMSKYDESLRYTGNWSQNVDYVVTPNNTAKILFLIPSSFFCVVFALFMSHL